jgi:hypothetical protein
MRPLKSLAIVALLFGVQCIVAMEGERKYSVDNDDEYGSLGEHSFAKYNRAYRCSAALDVINDQLENKVMAKNAVKERYKKSAITKAQRDTQLGHLRRAEKELKAKRGNLYTDFIDHNHWMRNPQNEQEITLRDTLKQKAEKNIGKAEEIKQRKKVK